MQVPSWSCKSPREGTPKDLVIVEADVSLVSDQLWLEDLSENLCHGSPVLAIGSSIVQWFRSRPLGCN